MMTGPTPLFIVADDFGIGPEVSRGILDLACSRRISASVLLVNSPFAESAVAAWRQAGEPMQLGWHVCLTLDRPLLPTEEVSSLVDKRGKFLSPIRLLTRLALGRVRREHIEAEIQAQYQRCQELIGKPPSIVNGHHHVHTFPLIGQSLRELLRRQRPLPYLRRVRLPKWKCLRLRPNLHQRLFLHLLGKAAATAQMKKGFPGADQLFGVGGLPHEVNSVGGIPSELMCHPGYLDASLLGRDAHAEVDLQKRCRELEILQQVLPPTPISHDAQARRLAAVYVSVAERRAWAAHAKCETSCGRSPP